MGKVLAVLLFLIFLPQILTGVGIVVLAVIVLALLLSTIF